MKDALLVVSVLARPQSFCCSNQRQMAFWGSFRAYVGDEGRNPTLIDIFVNPLCTNCLSLRKTLNPHPECCASPFSDHGFSRNHEDRQDATSRHHHYIAFNNNIILTLPPFTKQDVAANSTQLATFHCCCRSLLFAVSRSPWDAIFVKF